MNKLHAIICCIIVSTIFTGCGSFKTVVPEKIVEYPANDKLNFDINAEISNSITEAKYDLMGNSSNSYVLGENFKKNIDTLLGRIFNKYKIIKGGDEGDYAYTLVVELIKIEASIGMWAPNDAETTIIMQWSLKNSNKEIVWIDTVKGSGKSISGYGAGSENFVIMSNGRIDAAIKDVFINSYNSIYASPVIKKLSKSI